MQPDGSQGRSIEKTHEKLRHPRASKATREKDSGIKKAGNAAGFMSYITPKRDVTVITFSWKLFSLQGPSWPLPSSWQVPS